MLCRRLKNMETRYDCQDENLVWVNSPIAGYHASEMMLVEVFPFSLLNRSYSVFSMQEYKTGETYIKIKVV